MSSEKKVSAWAKAVSEHMKGGGHFPKKGSADYDAVMKIKERLSSTGETAKVAPAEMAKAVKKTTKAPKARESERDKEIERLAEEISALKKKYAEPAGAPSPHDRVPDSVDMLTKVAPKTRKPKAPKDSEIGHSVDVVAKDGHPVLSVAHTVPLGRLASVIQHAKLPFQ